MFAQIHISWPVLLSHGFVICFYFPQNKVVFFEASYISLIVVLKKNSNVLNPLTVHSSTNPLRPHSQTTKRNKQFNNDKSRIVN